MSENKANNPSARLWYKYNYMQDGSLLHVTKKPLYDRAVYLEAKIEFIQELSEIIGYPKALAFAELSLKKELTELVKEHNL